MKKLDQNFDKTVFTEKRDLNLVAVHQTLAYNNTQGSITPFIPSKMDFLDANLCYSCRKQPLPSHDEGK